MIVGHRQEDHLADGDSLALVLTQHHRTLHDGAGADHGSLRRNQNRGVGQGALGTDVGDGEGAAGQVVRLQLLVACTVSDVDDGLGQLRQGHVLRVVDNRAQQASLRVDGNTQVDLLVVGHLLGLRVVGCVDVRVGNQSLDRCLCEERQVGQVHTVLVGKGLLVGLAQFCNASHVDLVDLRQLSCSVQGIQGGLRGDLADAADLLSGAAQLLLGRIHLVGGSARASRGIGLRGGAGSGGAFCCGQDVLLADTAADAGSLDARQIDAMLLSQLAYQRSDVGEVALGRLRLLCSRLGGLGVRL